MPSPALDLLATPRSQDSGAAALGARQAPERYEINLPFRGVPLMQYAETARLHELDRLESYYRATQDLRKRYSWDGYLVGHGNDQPIEPGWYVPFALRRPAARYDLARVIVQRFTSFLFGTDRFPELRVEGDAEAEDYVRAMAEAARLPLRLIEARNLGGAIGTSVLSFCFVAGRPRVEVHNAKHCTVLRWADEAERRPGAVLKTYCYPRDVWDPDSRKVVRAGFVYARYWDEQREVVWEPIPQRVAEQPGWESRVRSSERVHGYGFTPVYWVQNTSDSQEIDGESDYEGLLEDLDEVNQLLSAAATGTKANLEPTLVVREDPAMNQGTIRKGRGNAIYSRGGADYLELKGQAQAAGLAVLGQLRSFVLETVGVVLADAEKMAGAAQSALAIEMLYKPMLARLDLLREQYGEFGVKPLLRDMVRAAALVESRTEIAADGSRTVGRVVLPARVQMEPPKEPGGEPVVRRTERRAPAAEELEITLNWLPYFPPGWEEIAKATDAAQKATGGKPVLSQRSAIAAVKTLWGVSDVDTELAAIEVESEAAMAQAQEMMRAEAETKAPGLGALEREEEDEKEDEKEEPAKKPPPGA